MSKLRSFEQGRRRGRPSSRAETGQAGQSSALASLQRGIGNQGMRRFLVQQHGSALTIQRDLLDDNESWLGEETPLGTGGGANTGTVTIQPVQNQFYNVTGRTLAEVGAQLGSSGNDEWGRCTFRYTPRYYWDSQGQITRVDITLDLIILMPRWTGSGWNNASAEAKTEWNRMIAALRAHEEQHAQIARRWANVFKQRLLGQSRDERDAIFNQVFAEVQAEQDQFDAQTEHGQTQGVTLDESIDQP